MSVSKDVKFEILNQPRQTDAVISMLCGETLFAGSLVIANKTISFEINSENEGFLDSFKEQLNKAFQVDPKFVKISKMSATKFQLSVNPQIGSKILDDLGIVRKSVSGEIEVMKLPSNEILIDEDCKRAFVAGAFVGAGSVSLPQNESKGGYHLEFVGGSNEKAEIISELLAEFNIISKKVERNGVNIVYLKGSDEICQTLALMGAVKAMLNIENNKVEREVRNNINRQTNCSIANLDKTISASTRDIDAIMTISETIGLSALPKNLREVAEIRLNDPQATLAQIAQRLNNKISRAAVSLRLKQIVNLSKTLGENDGE